jgi:hypothetical protein
MPLVRKVIKVGSSKAVTLPKDWIEYHEKKLRRPIEEVLVEVDEVLKIAPFVPEEIKEVNNLKNHKTR